MEPDNIRRRPAAETTAAIESSGTGWGVMEPGPVALQPGAGLGSDAARRYEVSELLGRGGMGEVHLAFDERVGRDVALKVLSQGLGERSAMRASFLREARLQGILDHPGIVPVHDVDRDREGRDFFVMKRVVGTTLEEVVRRIREGDASYSEKFPLRRLLSAYLQVCLTVDYAHSRGVVHRDLKPHNLMLGDFGEVFVLDWGIATTGGVEPHVRMSLGGDAPLESATAATYLVGTPGFMAPEQIDDPNLFEVRSDVYSLGAVLFGILTLERLHRGNNAFEVLESTRRGTDARPTVRAPDRDPPPEYDAICARATAVDPADRFPTVRALHDAVALVLDADRDTRLRIELAAEHLADAEHALSSSGGTELSQSDASRIALRHAARSLALHPQSADSAALVSRLMMTPPEKAPPEVEREMHELKSEEETRTTMAGAMLALAMLALTAALLAWSGVLSLGALAQMMVPLAFAIVFAVSAKLVSGGFYMSSLAAAVCIGVSASGMARVAGSLWFPASYVFLYACITMWNHGLGRWRIACIGVVMAGAWVPWVLEFVGAEPSQYLLDGERVLISPDMVAFLPFRTEVTFGLAQALALILTLASCLYFSRANQETQRRFQIMAWHLRSLAPDAGDDSRASTSTRPAALPPTLAPSAPAEVLPLSQEQPTTAPTRPDP